MIVMKTCVPKGLWLAALALLAAPTWAVDWYQVEVIAFHYANADSGSWAAATRLPDFTPATRLSEPPPDAAAAVPPTTAEPVAYQSLPQHALHLAGAYRVLARDGGLRPLFHVGWHQPAGESRAVYLAVPADPATATPVPAGELSTTIDPAAIAAQAQAGLPPLEGTVRLNLGAEPFQLNTSFIVREADTPLVLTEARRLKVDELHYLDHPLVGFLIQVTALAMPADPAEALSAPLPADAGALPD